MIRSTLSKAAWVGRTASMVFGLALVLALILGVASMALGANGDFFKVGRNNVASAVSTLTNRGDGPALSLKVDRGAPLAVNSSARVANLNADKLDNRDSAQFAPRSAFKTTVVIDDVPGPLPVSNTFTTNGGKLLITASGSGFRNTQVEGNMGMVVMVENLSGTSGEGRRVGVYTNELNSHKAFVSRQFVLEDRPAGRYRVVVEPMIDFFCGKAGEARSNYCTATDVNDRFHVTVVELPD